MKDEEGFVICSCYTRAQALEDGVLIDVSEVALQYRLMFPVAITQGVYSEISEMDDAMRNALEELVALGEAVKPIDPVHCVVQGLRIAIRLLRGPSDRVDFSIYLATGKVLDLYALVGPGDSGEPVITIMLPTED